MKTELEKVAEQFEYTDGIYGFKQGVKWQKERMFELVEEYNQMIIDSNVHEDHKEKSFKEWFEQFKKKQKLIIITTKNLKNEH